MSRMCLEVIWEGGLGKECDGLGRDQGWELLQLSAAYM